MRKKTNPKDNDFNAPFDQWLRGQKPPDPAFVKNMDQFLYGVSQKRAAEKKVRAAKRKKRLASGSAVMCVVLLSIGVFNFQDVGSDGFDLAEVKNTDIAGRIFKNEYRGDGFNVLGGETDQVVQEINHQIAAKEGEVVKVEGWSFQGETYWCVSRKFNALGESKILSDISKIPETKLTRKFLGFLIEQWPVFESQIETGEIKPGSKSTKQDIDGVTFLITSWFIDLPDGELIYFEGLPFLR